MVFLFHVISPTPEIRTNGDLRAAFDLSLEPHRTYVSVTNRKACTVLMQPLNILF